MIQNIRVIKGNLLNEAELRRTFDGGVRLLDIDDLGWSSWSDISQRCARLIDFILEVRHAGSSDVRCARTTTLHHSNNNVSKFAHALYAFRARRVRHRKAFEWKRENTKRDVRQLPQDWNLEILSTASLWNRDQEDANYELLQLTARHYICQR